MAYSVSQSFKTNIKDQDARKSCIVIFDDLWFDSNDFLVDGVTFTQHFNTSDDLTYGDCPSDTLSFSVISHGALAGYSFGKCRAYLGVQTDSQPYVFDSVNAYIEVGSYTWTASDSGLYCGSTLIDSDEYVSLVSDGTYVYAVGLSSSYKAKIDGSEGSAWTPNRFMVQKLRSGLSAVFSANTAHVWDGENVITYDYVPMGVYLAEKPRSTVGDTVVIQDAYDQMKLFDVDASDFLSSLKYPKTLSQIYVALCNYVGVSYVSSTFTYSTTSYPSSPFSDNSCTLRDILWWIAERARRVAHFNRIGSLDLMPIGTVQETLTASDIGQDGYSIAEYITPAVTGVLLKGTNGSSVSFGTLETPYVISSNPFVSTISDSDLEAYLQIPRYVPMELEILECDPSIDVGDMINIKPMVEEVSLLTDVYGQVYASLAALTVPGTDDVLANNGTMLVKGVAMAVESPTHTIPLMERTITFIGAIRAKYVATGGEAREADISDTEYNANVAPKVAEKNIDKALTQQNVFDRLTNNGQAQGIFLDANGDLYINGTYVRAHTVAVNKLTGTVSNNGWGIDFDNGTMSIGTLAVTSITGSLSTTSTSSSDWGIDFSTGTINIGTLAVSKITGTKTLDNNWGIDFDNGTMSIGNLSANNITAGSITAAVTATNLTMTGGSIRVTATDSTYNYISFSKDDDYSAMSVEGLSSRAKIESLVLKTAQYQAGNWTLRDLITNDEIYLSTGDGLVFDTVHVGPQTANAIAIKPVQVYSW